MATHLAGFSTRLAAVSVAIFYALSGYLSTLSIDSGRYNPIDFISSRFLRLWPTYICVLALTITAFSLGFIDSIGRGIHGWRFLLQLVMISPAWPIESIVAPAWMLKYILLGYFLVAIGCTSTPKKSALALIISILWANSIALMPGLPYGGYYLSAAFALQFIFAGACCYHLGIAIPRDGRWGTVAGELSYPVFLAHYGVGAAIGWPVGWPLFRASLGTTLALSGLLVVGVERPIARYRKKID